MLKSIALAGNEVSQTSIGNAAKVISFLLIFPFVMPCPALKVIGDW